MSKQELESVFLPVSILCLTFIVFLCYPICDLVVIYATYTFTTMGDTGLTTAIPNLCWEMFLTKSEERNPQEKYQQLHDVINV